MLPSKMNWKFQNEIMESTVWSDNQHIELSKVVIELLLQRGINTYKAVQDFLMPNLNHLSSPTELDGIDIACERVHEAIRNEEKILIYGDYDADGVSSTTVLLNTLQELGAICDYYIPNRFTEGYGPNETAFRTAHDEGFRVIITVDTGIASIHEAELARELGIDLIITDHHEPQDELPNAYTIIHPKCSPAYPFKELAGVGVAFKFSQALLGYFPEHLLDLVAIGTVADLVPLVEENRILTYYGLKTLTNTNRKGLKALMKLAGVEGNVTEEVVGFTIGPRLNAVGRLQDADLAVQLLTTDNQEEAVHLAEAVNDLNRKRQHIVASIVSEIDSMLHLTDAQGVIVVANTGWNEGVLGIVASRLVKKYERPAIVLSINETTNTAKGSARSIPSFDLFQNCMKRKELFTHFGGHSQAAGMTLPIENIDILQHELDQMIREQLTEEDFKQQLKISRTLEVSEVNEQLIKEISQLAPFGMGNPKPLFHISNIPSEIRQLGNEKKHLKMQLCQDEQMLEGIGFGIGHLYPLISPNTPISVVGELSINEWNGYRKPQIVIQDMKIDDWQLYDHRGRKIDITAFISYYKHQIILVNQISENETMIDENVEYVTYNSSDDKLKKTDCLYIMDLPKDLESLKRIIQKTRPDNVHVCFHVEKSIYLTPFPTREDFKWFYGFIWKHKKVNLKQELNRLMKAKNWSKENIIFMSKVFSELNFVTIDDGMIEIQTSPTKKDLQESKVYQERLNQAHIEKTLYYSTYEQLKKWFHDEIGHEGVLKEDIVHGL